MDLIASAWSLAYMLERRGDRRGRADAIVRANRLAGEGTGSADPDYSYKIGAIIRSCYVAVGLLPEPRSALTGLGVRARALRIREAQAARVRNGEVR